MNKPLFFLAILLASTLHSSAQTTPIAIDTSLGAYVQKSEYANYIELSHYLCDGINNEQLKANAIYNWITHNIKYDIKAAKSHSTKQTDPAVIFRKRKGVCEGYSVLFTAMCREAGLKAVNVEGYAKDWMFDNGDKLYIPRHMWAAVEINGKWELADPTWGAGGLSQSPGWMRRQLNKLTKNKVMYSKKVKFQFHYDPQYFMQDPLAFRFKHAPSDPEWQLTDTAMPIIVFEKGDSAIKQFNATYATLVQSNPDLDSVSTLDEDKKMFGYANRANKYNDNYKAILAVREEVRAVAEIQSCFTDSTIQNPDLVIADARNALKKSDDYIKEQKKYFPDHYSELKKKNTTKNQLAKAYIQKVRTDDKKLSAQCDKYAKSAKQKSDKANQKYTQVNKRKKGLSAQKIKDISGKTEKGNHDPALMALTDSIGAREGQIANLQKDITAKETLLQSARDENGIRLDTLADKLSAADSLLVLETRARLSLQDNYDDDVITYSEQFRILKNQGSDSLQKYYLANYDTVSALNDRLQKVQIQQMDVYKKTLRDLEQYKKWKGSDTTINAKYAEMVKSYTDAIDNYNKDIANYSGYIKGNKKLFENLTAVYKHEMKLLDYMDKAEEMRKELEEKEIAHDKSYDEKENELQKKALDRALAKVEKVIAMQNKEAK